MSVTENFIKRSEPRAAVLCTKETDERHRAENIAFQY